MKVLFMLPHPIEIASTRQRVFQFFSYLEKNDVKCHASSFVISHFHKIIYSPGRLLQKSLFTMGGFVRRLSDLQHLSKYDLVFIQREAFPFGTTFIEKIISSRKKIIYDFDDAIYMMGLTTKSLAPVLRRPSKVATIIKLSNCVIAGNQYLADYAAKYNSNVKIIPTCIDTDYYVPKYESEEKKKITIGWIGSRATISYLSVIKDALLRLSRKHDYVLKIVANAQIDLDIETEFKTWQLNEELNDLRSFDIGIMPLPDDEWTRAKCGYKIIQYMAVGKPVVASPVGVNREIIQDGINGFLAQGQRQWENKLSELIHNHSLRTEIGRRGRETIKQKYSFEVNAPKVLSIIHRFKV